MFVARADYLRIFKREQLQSIIHGLWPECRENTKIDWRRYPMWALPAQGQYKFIDANGFERGAMVFALDGHITSRDEIWFLFGPFETQDEAHDYPWQRMLLPPNAVAVTEERSAYNFGWVVSRPYTDG
jgi:hypothetical protein